MSRKSKITRTIIITEATILCVDVESGESFDHEVTLSGTFKTDKDILKASRAIIDTEYVKAVHVVKVERKQILYGMDEQTFIENAKILPARKKAAADDSSEVADVDEPLKDCPAEL